RLGERADDEGAGGEGLVVDAASGEPHLADGNGGLIDTDLRRRAPPDQRRRSRHRAVADHVATCKSRLCHGKAPPAVSPGKTVCAMPSALAFRPSMQRTCPSQVPAIIGSAKTRAPLALRRIALEICDRIGVEFTRG